MVIKIQPKADQIVKVLFENFCECCELGEEGCIQAETKTPCSVFWTIQFLCPDKPFVNRIMGRYMTCPNCQNIGMVPPGSAFDAPIQSWYASHAIAPCGEGNMGCWLTSLRILTSPLLSGLLTKMAC